MLRRSHYGKRPSPWFQYETPDSSRLDARSQWNVGRQHSKLQSARPNRVRQITRLLFSDWKRRKLRSKIMLAVLSLSGLVVLLALLMAAYCSVSRCKFTISNLVVYFASDSAQNCVISGLGRFKCYFWYHIMLFQGWLCGEDCAQLDFSVDI